MHQLPPDVCFLHLTGHIQDTLGSSPPTCPSAQSCWHQPSPGKYPQSWKVKTKSYIPPAQRTRELRCLSHLRCRRNTSDPSLDNKRMFGCWLSIAWTWYVKGNTHLSPNDHKNQLWCRGCEQCTSYCLAPRLRANDAAPTPLIVMLITCKVHWRVEW